MLCIPPVRAALTISIHSRSSLFCSVQGRKQNNFQKTDTGSRLLMWWRNYSSVCLLLPANWTISLPVAAAFCLLASLKTHWAIATRTLALASCEPSGVLEKREEKTTTINFYSLQCTGDAWRKRERERKGPLRLIDLAGFGTDHFDCRRQEEHVRSAFPAESNGH